MTRPVAALISCVSKKQNKPCSAIDLYTSPLFKKSVKFANKYGLSIYILSAKYYLVRSDRIIAPYDLTLNSMSRSELDQWAKVTAEQIKTEFNNGTLLVLAGSKYLSFTKYTDNPIIDPLKNLGIGKRLQYLDKHTKFKFN